MKIVFKIFKHFTFFNVCLGLTGIVFAALIKYLGVASFFLYLFNIDTTDIREYVLSGFISLNIRLGLKGVLEVILKDIDWTFINDNLKELLWGKPNYMNISDILNSPPSSPPTQKAVPIEPAQFDSPIDDPVNSEEENDSQTTTNEGAANDSSSEQVNDSQPITNEGAANDSSGEAGSGNIDDAGYETDPDRAEIYETGIEEMTYPVRDIPVHRIREYIDTTGTFLSDMKHNNRHTSGEYSQQEIDVHEERNRELCEELKRRIDENEANAESDDDYLINRKDLDIPCGPNCSIRGDDSENETSDEE